MSKEAKSALEAIEGKHGEEWELGKIIRIKFDSKNVLDIDFTSLHDGTNATPLAQHYISQLQGIPGQLKASVISLFQNWMDETNFNKLADYYDDRLYGNFATAHRQLLPLFIDHLTEAASGNQQLIDQLNSIKDTFIDGSEVPDNLVEENDLLKVPVHEYLPGVTMFKVDYRVYISN